MQSLNPKKKLDLFKQFESKKIIHLNITVDMHELLSTNYCGNPNYCALITAETPITAQVILR